MEQYLVSVAIRKGIGIAVKGIIAFALSAKALALEKQFGVKVDPQTFQAAIGSAVLAGEHMLHDWASMKWPNVKWLQGV